MTKLAWKRSQINRAIHWTSRHGHRVKQVFGMWHAVRPDGEIVRVETNDDGSPFVDRQFEGQILPQVRRFPTATAAKRFLEAEQGA